MTRRLSTISVSTAQRNMNLNQSILNSQDLFLAILLIKENVYVFMCKEKTYYKDRGDYKRP